MKKSVILSITTGLMLVSHASFANQQNSQDYTQPYPSSRDVENRYQNSTLSNPTLLKKEGWIEGGAELLFITSTLTPTVSGPSAITSNPGLSQFNSKLVSLDPEYNLSFKVDLRFRPSNDNDVSMNYYYLHNDADNNVNTTDVNPVGAAGTNTQTFDDKGSMHIHMHLADLMFGRSLTITPQVILRLSAGLSFFDAFAHFNFKNDDTNVTVNAGGVTTDVNNFQLHNKMKNRVWGLSPKLGLDFEYYFLPTRWSSDLNFFLNTQFALYYGKEWTRGRIRIFTQTLAATTLVDRRYELDPKHEFYPNINLDAGIKYRYTFSNDVKVALGVGYKVFAFWLLEELQRIRTFPGTEDFITNGLTEVDIVAFTGPYVRFSIAY